MRETYRDFVNHNAATFGRFLKHLSEKPTPQVFHCTAGKDRTGFAAALLLSALEVDRATIEHDYLLTNQLYKRDARLEGPHRDHGGFLRIHIPRHDALQTQHDGRAGHDRVGRLVGHGAMAALAVKGGGDVI